MYLTKIKRAIKSFSLIVACVLSFATWNTVYAISNPLVRINGIYSKNPPIFLRHIENIQNVNLTFVGNHEFPNHPPKFSTYHHDFNDSNSSIPLTMDFHYVTCANEVQGAPTILKIDYNGVEIGQVSIDPNPFINGTKEFIVKKFKDANNQVEVEVIYTYTDIEKFAHEDLLGNTQTKISGFLVLIESNSIKIQQALLKKKQTTISYKNKFGKKM